MVQDFQAKTAHIANVMVDDEGKGDFTPQVPSTSLVGDIMYLKKGQGWLYLCTVMNLATGVLNRMGPGASICVPAMSIDALTLSSDQGFLHADGAIYHTDRGTQFTSRQFQAWCAGNPHHPLDWNSWGVLG